ncbi:MAG: SDR family NAD(P)-dependent oxidoreductase [Acidimicrobiales bacterium]
MHISGRTVMLTGASGGLGGAIGRRLSEGGARLVITARNTAQLDELAAATGAEVIVADLCRPTDVEGLIARSDDIDILVANAGTGADLALPDDTSENIDRVLDVNLRAPIQLATAFAQRKLRTGAPAHIVFVGSLSGLAATPNTRLYNASKFGLRGFALSLRQDLTDTPIGVSIVEPGFIRDAGMFANSDIALPKAVRTKSPDDVARGVIDAIERNRGEVFVAPLELRLSATLATVAPGFSARVQAAVDTAGMKNGG